MDVGNSRFVFTHLHADGKEEKDGKPIVFPSQAELLIDSLDRYKDTATALYSEQTTAKLLGSVLGGAPGNRFQISVPRGLLYGYFNRLAITQVQLLYRVPTIVTGVNDTFYLAKNGGSISAITVAQGFYSPAQLATALQTAIRASPAGTAGYTVTYGSSPGGFLFATNTADTTCLWIPNFPPNVVTEAQAQVALRFARVIGAGRVAYGIQNPFPPPNNIDPQTSFRTFTPNFNYTDYVDIVSHKLCKFKRVKDNTTSDSGLADVVARVYLTPVDLQTSSVFYQQPFNVCAQYANPNFCKWSPEESFQDIDFELYDQFGNLLYWTTEWNTEFQITLLASET